MVFLGNYEINGYINLNPLKIPQETMETINALAICLTLVYYDTNRNYEH